MSVREVIKNWPAEDLANLAKIMGLAAPVTPLALEQAFRWAYHSKVRAGIESSTKRWFAKIADVPVDRREQHIENLHLPPDYEDLLRGVAARLRVLRPKESIQKQESYVTDAILVTALNKMNPEERRQFFEQPIDISQLAESAGGNDTRLAGSATTLVALSAAQASGFGVYVGATSALGFVTHAAGVTLPFAAYSGLSSTIAVLIGPAGFLAAAFWGAFALTGPEWKRLTQAVVYIIATKARLALADQAGQVRW